MKKLNNNYWAKKIHRFIVAKEEDANLDFDKFAKMDYKDLYHEAVGKLKTKDCKEGFRTLKKLSNYSNGSKILDVRKGPLLSKFNAETKGRTLRKEEEINKEIQAYLKEHYMDDQL
jgi:hypothetical protein